jgi:hypothetical protein
VDWRPNFSLWVELWPFPLWGSKYLIRKINIDEPKKVEVSKIHHCLPPATASCLNGSNVGRRPNFNMWAEFWLFP